MKKAIAWLLLAAMAFALTACSSNDPQTAAATPEPLPTETPGLLNRASSIMSAESPDDELGEWEEPVIDDAAADGDTADLPGEDLSAMLDDGGDGDILPLESPDATPIAAPAQTVKIKNYVLADYDDDSMQLSVQYPSHWTVEPGTNTVSFTEPVASGKTPMRLAVSAKTYTEDKLTAKQQTKEFNSFVKVVKGGYSKFKAGKTSNKLVFMNRSSLSCYYNAKLNGTKIRGFVIMANNARTKQIVALHFYAPLAKFKSSGTFFKKVLYSVTPMADAASATPSPAPTAAA